VDHAYALTGHKCEGITVDRVFVRGGGHADQQWAYTVMTRVRRRADLYLVETPDRALRDGADELDLAPPMSQRPYDVAIAALGRSGVKRMAIDQQCETQRPRPSTMSVKELREERDRLATLLATAPRSQQRQHDRIAQRLDEAEHILAATVARREERQEWLASHGRGLAGLAHREAVKAARADLTHLQQTEQVQRGRLDKLTAQERQLRRHEQQRAAWTEFHAADLDRDYQVGVELGWRTHARSQARTVDAPGWLADLLGPIPIPLVAGGSGDKPQNTSSATVTATVFRSRGWVSGRTIWCSGALGGTVNNSWPAWLNAPTTVHSSGRSTVAAVSLRSADPCWLPLERRLPRRW
jgi:hypothetical protein